MLTKIGDNIMTQTEFEKLPKEEQNFRWALFLKSNGHTRELIQKEINDLTLKYLVKKEKLDIFG
jgi:hypothetical protein